MCIMGKAAVSSDWKDCVRSQAVHLSVASVVVVYKDVACDVIAY